MKNYFIYKCSIVIKKRVYIHTYKSIVHTFLKNNNKVYLLVEYRDNNTGIIFKESIYKRKEKRYFRYNWF